MKRLAPLSALVLSLLVSSCGDRSRPPFEVEPAPPLFDIADAAHIGGNPHFWFLPPFLPPAEFSGVFKASADPRLTICELVDPEDPGQGCNDVVLIDDPTTKAVFALNPGAGEQALELSLADEFFRAQWKPSLYETNTASTYRVLIEERTASNTFVVLGWADIQLGENKSSLKHLSSDAVVGFVDNQTANIPFRIEEGSLPCDGVTGPCTLGVWVSGQQLFLQGQAPGAGPAQLFIPAGTTIAAEGGTALNAVLFSLSQKTGTSGCFDNLLFFDPGLNPANGNEPEVCWEVVAYDPVTQERLTVTFESPDATLPTLAFCPEPFVVQQELANPGTFNGASVPDDVFGQTITLLPDGSLPLGDPAYPGDSGFGYTAPECESVQSGLGAVGQADEGLVGQLSTLARRTFHFLRPRPLWAVDAGFVLQLPGTSTIYFPTTLPQEIVAFPPDPIRVDDVVTLAAAAVHNDVEVDDATLNLGWTTDDPAGAILTVGPDGTATGVGVGRVIVTATVLPFVGSSGITDVVVNSLVPGGGAIVAAITGATQALVVESLPCDGVTGPCTFDVWESGETFFVESEAAGAGPAQLFIPDGISATVNGQAVEDVMFSLRQQTGTSGCFDNLLIADPGLNPDNGFEPEVCWELLAVDPVTQDRLSVTFSENENGALPSLAFCPEPFVVQQELGNPGLFNGGSVPDDVAGQTITVMDETSLPLGDPTYPGDPAFSFTAQECLDAQESQVGMGTGGALGALAALVGRGLDALGPQPLWAVDAGFVLQLPGTSTIYFPTTTPEAISVVPPEPIEVGLSATLAPIARHHDADASARVLSLMWASSNVVVATVGSDGKVTGVAEGQSTITATVAPFPNSSGIVGVADVGGGTISAGVTVTVEAAVADLVVSNWAGDQLLSQTLVAGQAVDFGQLAIQNQGTGAAPSFSFEIRLWDAPPTSATTSFRLDLGTVHGGLTSGSTATLFPSPAIPETVTPGSGYYIGVVLDTQDGVNEGDAGEANNIVFSGPMTVEAPSLQISFVQQPTNTLSGQVISPGVSVAVTDAAGAPVPGAAVTLSNAANIVCGLTSSPTANTGANGTATFSGLTVQQSCQAGIRADASALGFQPATATSNTYLVFAGGRGTPVVDGILGTGEWDGATCFDRSMQNPGGEATTLTVCLMNDADNLYVNATFTRPAGVNAEFVVKLDMDEDGVVGPAFDLGDDVLTVTHVSGRETFLSGDRYTITSAPGGVVTALDDQQDLGVARAQDATGTDAIELSHPLNSGEIGQDVALAEGEWIDVQASLLLYITGGGSTSARLPERVDGLKWLICGIEQCGG